jgi:hypothetical protein
MTIDYAYKVFFRNQCPPPNCTRNVIVFLTFLEVWPFGCVHFAWWCYVAIANIPLEMLSTSNQQKLLWLYKVPCQGIQKIDESNKPKTLNYQTCNFFNSYISHMIDSLCILPLCDHASWFYVYGKEQFWNSS